MIYDIDSDTDSSPNSPPGMTTSKSSKTSSFHSSLHDDGSVLNDVGHFEDIGLEDDNDTVKNISQLGIYGVAPSSTGAPVPSGRILATNSHLSPKPRSSFPNLQTNFQNPRSTSLTVLADPGRPAPPSKRSSSRSNQSSSPRNRSLSPSNVALNPKGPRIPPKPRRGSWQPALRHRKSFAELEHECDEDEGDDIPEGMFLDNVPISPRPQHERPPSRQPSPAPSLDRSHKDRIRSVGNGTPPVAQAHGSLRSPTWKNEGESVSRERSPVGKPLKRTLSWNAGFAELSAEAKKLTEKLEAHADELEQQRTRQSLGSNRPNTWNPGRSSTEYSYEKKSRIKSTSELPPLRRTNVMIDPLPVSREKEAVLSRTRPSWLPPKDPAEEKRHLREYQKMMAASAKADERREAARRSKEQSKDVVVDGSMRVWEQDILARWDDAVRERKTREMWWRGVPPRSRGAVWSRAIGNPLGLSESSFDMALARAHELEQRVNDEKGTAEDAKSVQWFHEIRQDVTNKTWKDLRIFNVGGPLHDNLVDVLMAYAMYRNDIGYLSGCNTIAALLLLNLPTPASTFVALANLLNRSLPLSFYTSDAGAQSSAYNFVIQTLAAKSIPLYDHLKGIPDLKPEMYLHPIFTSLFTGQLVIDEASRLFDIYVFEGDNTLIRAVVAFLLTKETKLHGCKTMDDFFSVLSQPLAGEDGATAATQALATEQFIKAVREVKMS
ncbi:unnamed protein product [Clonostachys rosea]|uniref:Rab-GAP TBC domain-containing protein n=1 Tax=Bionectria ochroleuca TaxID=29856 RepID=A0ABY6U157_BIOOC|nr:unnamed protein product [Clonostachys rosea]